MIAQGRLILLLPQTDPWEVSKAGRFLIDRHSFMETWFSGLSKETLPWPQISQPRRMSPHLAKHGKPVWGKQMWKYFLSLS